MTKLLVELLWLEALSQPFAFSIVFLLGVALGCVIVEGFKAIVRWVWDRKGK